jgi:hypothetical protein
MSYDDDVDAEYLSQLQGPINNFLIACNMAPQSANPLPTLFFFPGGLGSKLNRATQHGQIVPGDFYTIWLDCSIAFGVASDLIMNGEEDYQQYYIVPDGCIDFVASYDPFISWCQNNNLNMFVFGWDWRRTSERAADFFLNKFLVAVNDAVAAGNFSFNPLCNMWLIGHSFGGVVIKHILNQTANTYVQNLKGAITVATSFYGYAGQLHRFFVGESDLNWTLPGGAAECTKIVSTLPGGYELLFLDGATYDANRAAFQHDPDGFNLMAYPSTDPNSDSRADPYYPNPGQPSAPPTSGKVRYLANYGFEWNLLGGGLTASRLTSQPLDPAIAAKFWTIRYVRTEDDGVTPLNDTAVGQTWPLVNWNYAPNPSTDPIKDDMGPGDGTLPAWSTRLIGCTNVVTVRAPDIEHLDLMNEGVIQVELASLLGLPAQFMLAAQANTGKSPVRAATRSELNKFEQSAIAAKEKARAEAKKHHDHQLATARREKKALLDVLRSYTLEQRQALLTRAYFDAFKVPKQLLDFSDKDGDTKPVPAKASPKTKASSKTKTEQKSKAKRK